MGGTCEVWHQNGRRQHNIHVCKDRFRLSEVVRKDKQIHTDNKLISYTYFYFLKTMKVV
jgi:hypothetical protein